MAVNVKKALKEKGVKVGDEVSWGTVNGRVSGIVAEGEDGLEVLVGLDRCMNLADVIFSESFRIEN